MLTACGGGGTTGTPAVTDPGFATDTFASGLPDVASILAVTREVSSGQCLSLNGSDYSTDLPACAVTVVNGDELEFTPDWTREQGGDLAYAIYSLNPGQGLPEGLDLTWAATGEGYTAWAGLLDRGEGCWDFYALDEAGDCTLDDARDYIDPATEELLALVVVAGTQACRLAGIGLQAEQPVIAGWPMYGQNPRHDCRTTVAGPEVPHTRWTYEFLRATDCRASAAVSAEGIVYVSSGSRLHALDGVDGAELWWHVDHGISSDTPTVSTAIVTTDGGELAFTSLDGSYIREQGVLGTIPGTTAVTGLGTVVPWSYNSWELTVFNPLTGERLSGLPFPEGALDGGTMITPLPVDASGGFYLNTYKTLNRIQADGTLGWQMNQGSNRYADGGPSLGLDGAVHVFRMRYDQPEPYWLQALDPATGEATWEAQVDFVNYSLPGLLSDGRVIVLCSDSHVRAIEPGTGGLSWEFDLGGTVQDPERHYYIAPAIDGNDVTYIGCSTGRFYAINPDGTEKWHYDAGSAVQCSPAIGPDGTIYFSEADGILHAVGDVTGPDAQLTVTPRYGPAPLTVSFDCSASTDESGIVSYDYDWDADGTYDLVGGGPVEGHAYDAGVYEARVRVVNTSGAAHTRKVTLQAGPFVAEVEPNDNLAEADMWPELSFPVSGFTGYVESWTGTLGGSNSSPDIFRFSAPAGSTLRLTCAADFAYEIAVWDSEMNELAAGETIDDQIVLEHTFTGDVPGPYYLVTWAGYLWECGYSLDITLTGP